MCGVFTAIKYVLTQNGWQEQFLMADSIETQQAMLNLTPSAADKVRELLDQEGDPSLGLRIFVAGGGCSGMQYGMTLDEVQDGDVVVELQGIRVLVDEMSAGYIQGSDVDYVDSLMGAGFTVNNPNAVSTCGCGHSFKTAGDSGAARSCGCGH
jgi:iron-sulfur cluster assembly accessory protein